MTDAEWARIAALIDGLWKDEFDKTRQASFYMVLAPFAAIDVYAAVIEFTDENRPFGPSIGELKSKLRVSVERERVPSYESAMTSVEEVASRCGAKGEREGIRSLEIEDPFLAMFVRRMGWEFAYYRRRSTGHNEAYSRHVYEACVDECAARRESYVATLAGAPLYVGLPDGSSSA